MLIEKNTKEMTHIRINWDDFRKIHPNKYVFQLVVDKLSMNFLQKLMDVPLVEDVYFFSKVGAGMHGINLLFKLHIVFKEL